MWQLVGAVLAIANLWSAALALALYGLFQGLSEGMYLQAGAMSVAAAAFFLAGCLCVPSVYYPLCRLFNWRAIGTEPVLQRIRPVWLLLAFPAVLGLGYLVTQAEKSGWILLPPFYVLAIGLPVILVLYMAVRRLPLGSSQRLWGVFDSGLVLGPGLILVFELFALLAFILLAAVMVASQPELIEQIRSLAEQASSQTLTQDELLQLLAPILQRPAVILGILAFAALVVPLIEEFFKPIGVWLLVGRGLSPAEGFAAGALSGAGYALFESLMLSEVGESWIWVVLGRAGTAVLHITTSGAVGWALVQAWSHKRILRFGLVYLVAVLVHGTWNAVVIVNAYFLLSAEQHTSSLPESLAVWVERGIPFLLVLIAIAMFAALIWINRRLALHVTSPASGPAESGDIRKTPAEIRELDEAG